MSGRCKWVGKPRGPADGRLVRESWRCKRSWRVRERALRLGKKACRLCGYQACLQALVRTRRKQAMQAWSHANGACSCWAATLGLAVGTYSGLGLPPLGLA